MISGMNRSIRPEDMFRSCRCWPVEGGLLPNGRPASGAGAGEAQEIQCAVATMSAVERVRYEQAGLDLTHVLVQPGRPVAAPGWVIEAGALRLRVVSSDDAGGLGLYTIYNCMWDGGEPG